MSRVTLSSEIATKQFFNGPQPIYICRHTDDYNFPFQYTRIHRLFRNYILLSCCVYWWKYSKTVFSSTYHNCLQDTSEVIMSSSLRESTAFSGRSLAAYQDSIWNKTWKVDIFCRKSLSCSAVLHWAFTEQWEIKRAVSLPSSYCYLVLCGTRQHLTRAVFCVSQFCYLILRAIRQHLSRADPIARALTPLVLYKRLADVCVFVCDRTTLQQRLINLMGWLLLQGDSGEHCYLWFSPKAGMKNTWKHDCKDKRASLFNQSARMKSGKC